LPILFIASTRPAKVDGVREAVQAIAARDGRFRDVELRTFDVGHAAPRMPLTEEAIVQGARARAAALLPAAREAGGECFAIGVEGGVDPLRGVPDAAHQLALKTWACVTDGRLWSFGAGGAVILPQAIADRVAAGEELGDVIDGLSQGAIRGTRGAWGLLTRDLVTRRDAFRTAVIAAFAPFYNAPLYGSGRSGAS
jgi:inosine/xanthosine triphosphatase